MTITKRLTKGSALTHTELDDNFTDLAGRMGWFDYNDAATATTPITVTGGGGEVALTNDELGTLTNKAYPPENVTDVWDATGGVFDWSELSLGDVVEIRLDVDVIIASVNTEIFIDLHLGTGGSAYTIQFTAAQNFKTAGTHKVVRYMGIYMGDTNTKDNGGQFKISADKTCTVKVNGWFCKVHKYTG